MKAILSELLELEIVSVPFALFGGAARNRSYLTSFARQVLQIKDTTPRKVRPRRF
jgi:hypothetical protein